MSSIDYYEKGTDLAAEGDYDGAIEVFNKGLEEHPDNFGILDRRAYAYCDKGETEKALADFTRMVTLYPEKRTGWNARGNLYDEIGEYDKAIADFTQCIPLSPPNHGGYWANRGISYYRKGDLDAALADFNKSIELWGEEHECAAWPLLHRGSVWRKKGDMDKALEDFTLASKYDPESSDAFYYAGYIWFVRQNYTKAIKCFSKAIAIKDDKADYRLARGVCYWNQCLQKGIGFWNKGSKVINLADDDFTKAIEYAPDMADAYFKRGMVRCYKAQESHNLIKSIITQKVTDEAKRVLILAQLEHLGAKDFIPKFDALLRGLRFNRDQIDVLIVKSVDLMATDDAEEAIEDLSRAIDLDGDNAEAYYQRGLAYALTGSKDKALADYEQTYALYPYHRKAAQKRDELLKAGNE
jgi:tetratricopeptide (TPR) repeat protein